jgi:hypothetical protein
MHDIRRVIDMNAKWLKDFKWNYQTWKKLGYIDPKAFTPKGDKVTVYLPLYDEFSGEDVKTLSHKFSVKKLDEEILLVEQHKVQLSNLIENLVELRKDVAKKEKR